MSGHEAGPPCKSGLMLKGEHFPCDWPTSEDGTHVGWAHANKPAEAVWSDGPSVPAAVIATQDDLDQVQDALVHFDWSHIAVEDKHRRAWLLVEDEGGVMWGTYGETEVTWRPAREVLDAYGPLRVLQDLSPALTFTEQEADRNARGGSEGLMPTIEATFAPRPCCHTTGPHHHPACTTNRTEP